MSIEEILRKVMDEFPRDAKLAVAAPTLVREEVLKALAADKDSLIRREVAANPNTPEQTRINLLKDENGSVRLAAAANLKTSDRLSSFASAEDVWLRVGAARNSLLSDGEKRKLLEDKDPWVRESAAAHLEEDSESFRSLARQRDWAIRCRLASNKNLTDQRTAEIVAEDKDCDIRRYLACSGSVGADHVRMKLARDKEESVRMAACKHLAYKAEEIHEILGRKDRARKAIRYLAANPSVSLDQF